MSYMPKCDRCGRFMRPGSPGSSWVMVPDCDIPGEWGDERDRCPTCTEEHGPAVCATKYRRDLCCGVVPATTSAEGAAGIGSITPRTFRVLPSDSPPPAPDVLISKLANLRAMATERHVPEIDIATIDLAIEHLRYFSTAPSHRLSDARMDGIYNAWRDMGDDVSYGDLMRMVEAEIQGGK